MQSENVPQPKQDSKNVAVAPFGENEVFLAALNNQELFIQEEELLNDESPLFTDEEFNTMLANEDPGDADLTELISEGSFHFMSTNHSMLVLMDEMNVKKDVMSTSESSKRKERGAAKDTASSGVKRAKK